MDTTYPQCNRDNMRKLIHALESGEYQQGRRRLRITTGTVKRYCCAGVACDLAAADGVGSWTATDDVFRDAGWKPGAPADYENGLNGASRDVMTSGVVNWLGLERRYYAANLPYSDLTSGETLGDHASTWLNDAGVSFKEIAAKLRAYYGITA